MSRIFGITTSTSGVTGIAVNNISFNESVETAEARGLDGKVELIYAYSKGTTVDVQGKVNGEMISAGTIVTVGADNYLVTTTTKGEPNQDFQDASFSARKADNAILSGYIE